MTHRLAFALACATALAAVITGALAPASALACAACACGDPTLTLMGTGKSFAGRLRVSAEWQRRSETTPALVGETAVVEQRLVLGAAWSLVDTVQLALAAPIVTRTVDYETLARDTTTHVGDVELRARWIPLGARGFGVRHQAGVDLGVRAPLSPAARDPAGALLPLDAQTGLGGWQVEAGGFYALFDPPWSLRTGARGVLSTEGYGGFAAGPTALVTAFAQREVGAAVALRLGLDGRYGGRDTERGVEVAASGGATLYATGGVLWAPATDWLLHGLVSWPLHDERRGGERAGPTLSAGVTLDL